jgi:ligand-binding sensor domain-containing protein|tara:strand:- start:1014 stop:2159 length:1146 start_codon:yes stop_codon:yes gene_type:complete
MFQLGPLGALFAQGNWQNFTTENTILVDNQINDVLIVDGVKWIGTSWGLYTYDNDTWVNYTDVLPHPFVNSIACDKEGNIYACTLSGIAVYDGISWETITSQNSIMTSHVNEVVFDDNNVAYVGTIDGLFTINNGDVSLLLDTSSLENNFINVRCLAFKGDSLCIGTVNGGLGYLYNNTISWYNTSNGLIDNTATDLVVDNENLWITAPYGGLISQLISESFLIFNTGYFSDWPSNSLNTLYKDNDENLFYIGSSGGGFFSFTYESGIQSTTTYNTDNSDLINDYVLCIEKDEKGYWIGTEGGLVYWSMVADIETKNNIPYFYQNMSQLVFEKPSDINVYSLDGKLVFSSKKTTSVDLSFLTKGYYIADINKKSSTLFLTN